MINTTPTHTFLAFLALLLLLLGLAPACAPSTDDDDSADDDDSPPSGSCGDPALAEALQTMGSWSIKISCGHFFSAATAADTFRLGVGFNVPKGPEPVVGNTRTQRG